MNTDQLLASPLDFIRLFLLKRKSLLSLQFRQVLLDLLFYLFFTITLSVFYAQISQSLFKRRWSGRLLFWFSLEAIHPTLSQLTAQYSSVNFSPIFQKFCRNINNSCFSLMIAKSNSNCLIFRCDKRSQRISKALQIFIICICQSNNILIHQNPHHLTRRIWEHFCDPQNAISNPHLFDLNPNMSIFNFKSLLST